MFCQIKPVPLITRFVRIVVLLAFFFFILLLVLLLCTQYSSTARGPRSPLSSPLQWREFSPFACDALCRPRRPSLHHFQFLLHTRGSINHNKKQKNTTDRTNLFSTYSFLYAIPSTCVKKDRIPPAAVVSSSPFHLSKARQVPLPQKQNKSKSLDGHVSLAKVPKQRKSINYIKLRKKENRGNRKGYRKGRASAP